VGTTPSQLGRQVSSFQMAQQRLPPQGFLGERMKPATTIPTNQSKPAMSTISQAAVGSASNDAAPNVVKVFSHSHLSSPSIIYKMLDIFF
jgi:hypothetical protein